MHFVRCISRAAPRLITRTSLWTVRPLSTLSQPQFSRHSWPNPIRIGASFSTSRSVKEPAGECEAISGFRFNCETDSDPCTADLELSAKLDQELRLETESRDPSEVPPSVQDYINNGPFKVEDTPGLEEVVLRRTLGDETIKVTFSIADLNDIGEEASHYDEDAALADEELDLNDDLPPARSKRVLGQTGAKAGEGEAAVEDSNAERLIQGDEERSAVEDQISFSTQLNITISKPGKGAIQIAASAQDGLIEIADVFYFPQADLADPNTAEKMRARDNVYAGPPFGNLDSDLQAMLERYLDERGINSQLATFVPDFIDYKEQREYVQWLENMKSFIDA